MGPGTAWFRYRILYVVKGRPRLQRGALVAVKSSGDSASCGLAGRRGRRYGLVIHRFGRRWWGNVCELYDPRLMRAQRPTEAGRGVRRDCAA